jgi:non-specific protein-tyrosine kinase
VELKRISSVLWKWKWLIALVMTVAAVSSYWQSLQSPRLYLTTTTLLVGQALQNANPQQADFSLGDQLAQSYAQQVTHQPIAEAAVNALGLNVPWQALAAQVTALAPPGTQSLQIRVLDNDPQRAALIANELAHQVILQSPTARENADAGKSEFVNQQMQDIQSKIALTNQQIADLQTQLAAETSATGVQRIQTQLAAAQQKLGEWQSTYAKLLDFTTQPRPNHLSVLEPAAVPTVPVSPQSRLDALAATATALVLAVGTVFLIEYLDDTLKTDSDVERVLRLPTLSTIPGVGGMRQVRDRLVALRRPASPMADAYRVLRTNIQFSSVDSAASSVLISSTCAGEGKSLTAANLAITLAQAQRQVILVDANLRRPTLHQLFNVPNRVGLTSLLLDRTLPLDEALSATSVPGLALLTTGPLPPNPSELLSSASMRERLDQLPATADIIVFDSPPLLGSPDAAILAALCNAVLLIADSRRTRQGVVLEGKAILDQVGARVIGVVLNRVRSTGGRYGRYRAVALAGGSGWRRFASVLGSPFRRIADMAADAVHR